MDEMYLRDHHHRHHHHPGEPPQLRSLVTQGDMVQKMPGKLASRRQARARQQVQNQEAAVGAGPQQLRLKINGRERKRMHDLNLAMDRLREVMPYAHSGPSVRKLSKITTLPTGQKPHPHAHQLLGGDEEGWLVRSAGHHSAFHCGDRGPLGRPQRTPPTPCTRRIHPGRRALLWQRLDPSVRCLAARHRHHPASPLAAQGAVHASGAAAGQRLPALGRGPSCICQMPPPPHLSALSTANAAELSAESKDLLK